MRSTVRPQGDAGIGERLAAARRRLGWTREELAFRAGVSWPAIAQIESGRRVHPRPATLSTLAEALGVTIDYLVRGIPPEEPMVEHIALLYEDGEEFAETVTPFVTDGLDRSEAVMVVTTPANVELVRGSLGRAQRRVDFMDSATWYSAAATTLGAYRNYASDKLKAGASWVRVVGELAWSGRTAAEARQWGRYESLIDLAFASWPVTVLCPYNRRSLEPRIVRQACATHPETLADGEPVPSPDYVDPGGFVLTSGV